MIRAEELFFLGEHLKPNNIDTRMICQPYQSLFNFGHVQRMN